MLSTGIVVLIAIIALLIGAVGGFFLARKYMKDYLEKNPPVNEDMLREENSPDDAANEEPREKIGSDPTTFYGLIFSARFLFRNLLDYSDYSAKKTSTDNPRLLIKTKEE